MEIKKLKIVLYFSIPLFLCCNKSEQNKLVVEESAKIIIPTESKSGEIRNIYYGCGYNYKLNKNDIILNLPQSREIDQIKNILTFSGIPMNFEFYSANINNAVATMINGKRYVIYDPKLFNFSDAISNTYWSSMSILAHEIGHHLSGHTLSETHDSHKNELEADKYSGFVLYKMGATLAQATVAIELLGSNTESETHPAKLERIAAINDGWNEAAKQRYVSAIPPPPADENSFSTGDYIKDEFTKEELIGESALNEINFGGVINKYNFPDDEGIIIDVEKIDPTDGARTDYFNEPKSEFNMVLTIQLTKTTTDPFGEVSEEGKRYKFHLLDHYHMCKADESWLEALLVPGRKIRFKSFYFGYGAQDIFYIKRLNR